jgi:NADP-dependent 3-hydroxy acid dehydrogenase YdfG
MSVFRASSHALITGGASGIGYAVAELCLKNSMKVTIADSNQETLDLAKKNLSGDVHCVKTDVSDVGAWKKLKEQTGDVDFLMLNAGRMVKGTWGDSDYFNQVSCIIYTGSLHRNTYPISHTHHPPNLPPNRSSKQTSTA